MITYKLKGEHIVFVYPYLKSNNPKVENVKRQIENGLISKDFDLNQEYDIIIDGKTLVDIYVILSEAPEGMTSYINNQLMNNVSSQLVGLLAEKGFNVITGFTDLNQPIFDFSGTINSETGKFDSVAEVLIHLLAKRDNLWNEKEQHLLDSIQSIKDIAGLTD